MCWRKGYDVVAQAGKREAFEKRNLRPDSARPDCALYLD